MFNPYIPLAIVVQVLATLGWWYYENAISLYDAAVLVVIIGLPLMEKYVIPNTLTKRLIAIGLINLSIMVFPSAVVIALLATIITLMVINTRSVKMSTFTSVVLGGYGAGTVAMGVVFDRDLFVAGVFMIIMSAMVDVLANVFQKEEVDKLRPN